MSSQVPSDLRYAKSHEWVRVNGDVATVGISDYAQSQLGDITYVELPTEGQAVKQGDSVSVVESVKAASDIYSPASGTVFISRLTTNPNRAGSAAVMTTPSR